MNTRLIALIPAALLLAACSYETPPATASETTITDTGSIVPMDIPGGFGYPGIREEFQYWADNWVIDNITATAWNLWAGMTLDSGQTWNGANLPVWETWCGNEEVFSTTGCATLDRPARAFQAPSQVSHSAEVATANDTQVVSFNKFNPSMANYLAAQHSGPAGANYSYISMQDLSALNSAWPNGTPIAARKLADAPYQADSAHAKGFTGIETKPVIFVVKATGLTPMPLWQGPAGAKSGSQNNATPETWLTCVLLDPANSAGSYTAPVAATPAQIAQAVTNPQLSCQTYLYAPLSTIYNFSMDQAEAEGWNSLQEEPGITAEAGDYGVLAAMHVNTKTTINWTWQTFWWQPGADTPNAFPGSKQGMTDNVKDAWRNYAMCSAWNQTKGNASSEMVVCFNPFLETSKGIPAGQTSNCMSCHGVATVGSPLAKGQLPTLNYPPAYTQPIDFDNDPRFATFTRTDFSWAIPVNAIDTASTPASAQTPQ